MKRPRQVEYEIDFEGAGKPPHHYWTLYARALEKYCDYLEKQSSEGFFKLSNWEFDSISVDDIPFTGTRKELLDLLNDGFTHTILMMLDSNRGQEPDSSLIASSIEARKEEEEAREALESLGVPKEAQEFGGRKVPWKVDGSEVLVTEELPRMETSDETRRLVLLESITRFTMASKRIPPEWVVEYNSLTLKLNRN